MRKGSAGVQVVVPMAGSGQRFVDAGYATPKPLLPVHGRSMFEVVLSNLASDKVERFIVVAQRAWMLGSQVERVSASLGIPVELIEIDHLTGGPAETVLLTADRLDPGSPVVTANSDQFVNASLDAFYGDLQSRNTGGVLLTMQDDDPKWSYAEVDSHLHVRRIVEKQVISTFATVGIYGFATAETMINGIHEMKRANDVVNGEFYVAPAYNYLIAAGQEVVVQDLGPIDSVMYGMGIPEDYERFIRNPISVKAAG